MTTQGYRAERGPIEGEDSNIRENRELRDGIRQLGNEIKESILEMKKENLELRNELLDLKMEMKRKLPEYSG